MPIHSCTSGGKSGKQWGGKGRCYVGKGAAARAGRQAEAAYSNGYKGHAERRAKAKPAKLQQFSEGHGLHGVEIFAAGTHRGKHYSDRDLDDITRNFERCSTGERAQLRVPTVLGHEETQEFLERSDLPALAWPDRVYRRGHKLLADYDEIAPKVRQLLKNKAYRTVSSEIYDDPPEGIRGARGKMLRRIAFLGGDIPQVKSIDEILAATTHSEGGAGRGFASHPPTRITLARVSERPLAGAYVCFSEVFPMTREELLKALQEQGFDTSTLGEQVPDEALAEILRVLDDQGDQEGDSDAAGDEPGPQEHDEDEKHEDYDDPTAEGHPSSQVDDLELHDEDEEHEDYDDEPPDLDSPEEKKGALAKMRAMKRYAEAGIKKYCDAEKMSGSDEIRGKNQDGQRRAMWYKDPDNPYDDHSEPKPMGKFSEKALVAVVNKAVEKALAGQVGKKIRHFESFTEQQLASQKKATVRAFCEEMVRAGKLTPAEADRRSRSSTYHRLLRADAARVHKFSEKGKTVKKSELDLQMEEIRARRPFTFGERVKSHEPGKAGSLDRDGETVVSSHYERFREDYQKNGISRDKLLDDYKGLSPENKKVMLAEYQRLQTA